MDTNFENNGDFKFIYEKDPKLNPNSDIKLGDDSVKFSYITENFPINKDNPISLLVYWDDVVQFTSIGLIEIINSLYKTNAKIDLEHFFSRPNEYSNGMNYVYKIFEKNIKKDEIDKIKKSKYWQLLEISIKSSIFAALGRISSYVNKIGFYFPYHFVNDNSLKVGLNSSYFGDSNPNGVQFYYANERSFNSILKDFTYNAIITPNAKDTYEYILDNDLKRISILTPDSHNGFTDELYKLLNKMQRGPKPNYCEISFFKEQIFI